MRNIEEIIKDDRNGKQLSQTERQIAVAYIQGKYDAVRELNLTDNNSNTNEVLDKIRAEIEEYKSRQLTLAIGVDDLEKGKQIAIEYVLGIINKYKAESSEEKK